jgi:hypothetical protein
MAAEIRPSPGLLTVPRFLDRRDGTLRTFRDYCNITSFMFAGKAISFPKRKLREMRNLECIFGASTL